MLAPTNVVKLPFDSEFEIKWVAKLKNSENPRKPLIFVPRPGYAT